MLSTPAAHKHEANVNQATSPNHGPNEVLKSQKQQQLQQRPSGDVTRTSTSKSLPAIIDEDDPMLNYPPENWIASMMGTAGLVYRFSERLVYKSNVTPREVSLMEVAGGELTMRPLTRVVSKGTRPAVGTKAVTMELGRRFRARSVTPAHRHAVVVDMFLLLERLHKSPRHIIHGDIKESNFVWGRDGRLRLVDFSSARFIGEHAALWNPAYATETYFTPDRMRQKEESRLSCRESTHSGSVNVNNTTASAGVPPPPTVFDDYYALAITIWSIYTGKRPRNRQFNTEHIRRPDLLEVDDEMVRSWMKKVFKMAGCKFYTPETRSERGSSQLDPTLPPPITGQVNTAAPRQSHG